MAKYNKKIVEKICNLINSDSYTISEICKIANISEDTYHTWKKEKSDFSESIKKAENDRIQYFVKEAKKSLIKKIQGYTVQEKHIVMVGSGKYDENGNEKSKIKEQKVIDKYFQPDTGAIIFTLTNGDPVNWKNYKNTDLTTGGEKISFPMKINIIRNNERN
jgi:hypothetical protein